MALKEAPRDHYPTQDKGQHSRGVNCHRFIMPIVVLLCPTESIKLKALGDKVYRQSSETSRPGVTRPQITKFYFSRECIEIGMEI